MAQTAARNAGTVVNDNSAGTAAWTNPGNAQGAANSVVATVASGTSTTQRLKATNFGFTTSDIPTGSTINGFIIAVRGRGGTNNRTTSSELFCVRAGTTQTGASNIGTGKGNWSNTLADRAFGSASEKFGLSWAVSDVTDSGFGISLQNSRSNTTTIEVDSVSIIVDYTPAAVPIYKDLTAATETGGAQSRTPAKKLGITAAGETGAAQASAGFKHGVTLTAATSTDAAQVLFVSHPISMAIVATVDAAQALDLDKAVAVAPQLATETDAAQTLDWEFAVEGSNVVVTVRMDNGDLVISDDVRYAVYKYAEGVVANADWMTLTDTGTAGTDSGGVLTVPSAEAQGATVYLAVFYPAAVPIESAIWPVVTQ